MPSSEAPKLTDLQQACDLHVIEHMIRDSSGAIRIPWDAGNWPEDATAADMLASVRRVQANLGTSPGKAILAYQGATVGGEMTASIESSDEPFEREEVVEIRREPDWIDHAMGVLIVVGAVALVGAALIYSAVSFGWIKL